MNDEHTFVILAYKESKYLEDCIKSVTNQSVKSNVVIATTTDNDYIISSAVGGYYSYILTPLIIWYQGGMEVKIINNVSIPQ